MFVQPFYFLNWNDDFFFNFYETYNNQWERDTGTILRPTRSSIRICGWRQDHLVDPIKIRCTGSPTLWPRTYGRSVVSQPLGAPNQYRAPNLRSSWPCSNTRLISLKNTTNSRWIMNNSAKWSWTWDHRWVVRVCPFFGHIVPGTTNLLLLSSISAIVLVQFSFGNTWKL